MTAPLVLSIFPGIDLLGMAFEEEGFTVVRGPDLLWGGRIQTFHPPAGRFDGVIGGDPCPAHSHLGVVSAGAGCEVAPDLSSEFRRCVWEGQPAWWLRENVPGAPPLTIAGYLTWRGSLDNRDDCGGVQRRRRIFDFGTRVGAPLPFEWWRPAVPCELIPTVTANATVWKDGRAFGDKSERYYRDVMLPAQGLPPDFLEKAPFTVAGKIRVVGNGVPLPMGRAIARAVKQALAERVA